MTDALTCKNYYFLKLFRIKSSGHTCEFLCYLMHSFHHFLTAWFGIKIIPKIINFSCKCTTHKVGRFERGLNGLDSSFKAYRISFGVGGKYHWCHGSPDLTLWTLVFLYTHFSPSVPIFCSCVLVATFTQIWTDQQCCRILAWHVAIRGIIAQIYVLWLHP